MLSKWSTAWWRVGDSQQIVHARGVEDEPSRRYGEENRIGVELEMQIIHSIFHNDWDIYCPTNTNFDPTCEFEYKLERIQQYRLSVSESGAECYAIGPQGHAQLMENGNEDSSVMGRMEPVYSGPDIPLWRFHW